MAAVTIVDVTVHTPVAKLTDDLSLHVKFDCLRHLEEDVEWTLTYVGSAKSNEYDQELDSLFVGPIPVGRNAFDITCPAPDPARIPADDVIGVTAILLTAKYLDQEFVRVGYYVSVYYPEQLELGEAFVQPQPHDFSRVMRSILTNEPRVTYFDIIWDKQQLEEEQRRARQAEAERMLQHQKAMQAQLQARQPSVPLSPTGVLSSAGTNGVA